MRFIRSMIVSILKLAFFLSVLAALIFFCTLSTRHSLEPSATPSSEAIAETSQWLNNLRTNLKPDGKNELVLSQKQLDTLISISETKLEPLRLRAVLSDGSIQMQYSYRAHPKYPIFATGSFRIDQDKPFEIADAKLGLMPLPSGIMNSLVRSSAKKLLDEDIFAVGEQHLEALNIESESLNAQFTVPSSYQQRLQKIVQKQSLRELENLQLSGAQIELYMRDFIELSRGENAKSEKHSLAFYLQHLLTEARLNPTEHDLVAGTVALTLLNDSNLLHRFLPVDASLAKRDIPLTLHGRRDLSKHYLISASIELLTRNGLSYSIGTAKEILDADGGSGFSFRDLAADRAGVNFASLISPYDDLTLLPRIESLREEDILPELNELKEGLNIEAFEAEYQNTQSQAYRQVVEQIDEKIKASPFYSAFN